MCHSRVHSRRRHRLPSAIPAGSRAGQSATTMRFRVSTSRRPKIRDFEQAFVQSDLDLDLYIRWPPGIKQFIDPSGRQTALLVKRAQYAAKQSPRCWGLKLHKFLTEAGFKRSSTDSCLYLMDWRSTDGCQKQIALVVYVDDLLARVKLEDTETKQRYEKFVK